MRKVIRLACILALAIYPFAVYLGERYVSPRYIGLALAFLLSCRFLLLQENNTRELKVLAIAITLAGVIFSLSAAIVNNNLLIKLYPLTINIFMLSIFGYSLINPPTMIERFARLLQPNLPPAVIAYTRKVTIVWCLFFIINGLISLWTVLFCSTKTWMLYNGFICYIFMGALFGIEFLIRCCVQKTSRIC